MRDIIALLRTLILPSGATSGPRIVLNGDLGRIEVYGSAGDLLLTIDDDGLQVYDATGAIRTRVGIPGLFSTISFFDTSGNAAVLAAQAPGVDYELWTIQAINGSKGFGRLLFLSPTNTTKNPLLQWDTGFLTSDVAQPIVDLTGFTGTRAAVVAADDYKIATNNGGANAPTLGKSLPRGIMDVVKTTSDVGPTSGTTELDVITANAVTPAKTGRRLKISLDIRSINGSVLGDIFVVRIKEGATQHNERSIRIQAAGTGAQGLHLEAIIDSPSVASHTYKATIVRVLGTGTATVEGAAGRPIQLVVEDAGAV